MKLLKDIYYSEEEISEKSLDIYIPDGECKAAFLYIHGGGIEHGDKADMHREGEYLADRGYAFISIKRGIARPARWVRTLRISSPLV